MIILTVGILLTYVRPTFLEIGSLQTTITDYKVELEKINSTNDKLTALTQKAESISSSDSKALLTYMPDIVDDVAVARDIFAMSQLSETYLETISYDGLTNVRSLGNEVAAESMPVSHSFGVSISGTYDQMKDFFSKLEQNNYPLEIKTLKMSSSENGLINSEITIVTYSHI